MGSLVDQIVETWSIHNRINLYLLAALPPEQLGLSSGGGSRAVGDIFAHIHNVRLMWLQAAAPDLMEGLTKIEKGAAVSDGLKDALAASGVAVEALLRRSWEGDGKIKNFKPHAVAFCGYLISHESHHRGQITSLLKAGGHTLDNKTDYGMWEWGVR